VVVAEFVAAGMQSPQHIRTSRVVCQIMFFVLVVVQVLDLLARGPLLGIADVFPPLRPRAFALGDGVFFANLSTKV